MFSKVEIYHMGVEMRNREEDRQINYFYREKSLEPESIFKRFGVGVGLVGGVLHKTCR